MSNATQAVVEGKMEPVTKAPETRQVVITGQALYDAFVAPTGESQTRMALIRSLVDKADALQIQGACDAMVELAKQRDRDAGVPEKIMVDGKEKTNRGPKQASAMNVRTIFQQVWGALRIAPEQMRALGYTNDTGWLEASVIAKKALASAGKVWQGFDVPTQAQKEQKAAIRAQKPILEAQLQATKETPQALNESYSSWQARIAAKAQGLVEKAKQTKINNDALALFEYATKKYDRAAIALAMDLFGEYIKQENAGESEISEEEANALMAKAAEEGAIEVTEAEEQHA